MGKMDLENFLFDGFEWFFTGEIHLLEKELQSNVSRYAGNVLKNRYASMMKAQELM